MADLRLHRAFSSIQDNTESYHGLAMLEHDPNALLSWSLMQQSISNGCRQLPTKKGTDCLCKKALLHTPPLALGNLSSATCKDAFCKSIWCAVTHQRIIACQDKRLADASVGRPFFTRHTCHCTLRSNEYTAEACHGHAKL